MTAVRVDPDRIAAMAAEGQSVRTIAQELGISASSVYLRSAPFRGTTMHTLGHRFGFFRWSEGSAAKDRFNAASIWLSSAIFASNRSRYAIVIDVIAVRTVWTVNNVLLRCLNHLAGRLLLLHLRQHLPLEFFQLGNRHHLAQRNGF